METRKLGRTGVDVGIVGLGLEHLGPQPRAMVTHVLHEAIDRGVNYLDLMVWTAENKDKIGAALHGRRDRVLLAGHLGVAETNGQYRRSRDVAECETLIHDLLRRLGTDYVDILHLSYVDEPDDYAQVCAVGGLLELALRLQREGKARFIGLSGHAGTIARQTARDGYVDVLMQPVNLAAGADTREMLELCAGLDVAVVAMKPFAGGEMFRKSAVVPVTAVRCLSYTLSQTGVSTVVPGVRDVDELEAALAYLDAPAEARDFSGLLAELQHDLQGTCVYCNHCLPCPVGIEIAETLRLVKAAQNGVTPALRHAYQALAATASGCTNCGDCETRCPFGVPVVERLGRAVALFEMA